MQAFLQHTDNNNDLDFSPHSAASPAQSGLASSWCHNFYFASSFLLPYRTHSHSSSLSCCLSLPLPSPSLPSLFLLCYTVERWKSFLYPTHHSLVTINSIYVFLNHRFCEAPSTCMNLLEHTIAYEHACLRRPHTSTRLISSIFSVT